MLSALHFPNFYDFALEYQRLSGVSEATDNGRRPICVMPSRIDCRRHVGCRLGVQLADLLTGRNIENLDMAAAGYRHTLSILAHDGRLSALLLENRLGSSRVYHLYCLSLLVKSDDQA